MTTIFLLGLPLGGVLSTGQSEPLRWLSVSPYFAAILAFLFRHRASRWVSYAIATLLFALAVLIFCGVAGRYWSWSHALLLGIVNLALLAAMDMLFRIWRASGFILGAALLMGLLLPARTYLWMLEARPAPERESLVVMTSLPIGPMRGRDIPQVLKEGSGVDPVATSLSRHFRLRYTDYLSNASLRGEKRLLLAHPRALRPVELVDLDRWIRAGGRALILADPLLSWPVDIPLGDPRRPHVTSLLDPLLAHWGLRLEPAADEQVRRMRFQGRLLATTGVSRFALTKAGCRLTEGGFLAHCRLGRGEALLVADADLINPMLWMGEEDGTAGRESNRIADNMQLVLRWLGLPEARLAPKTGWIL